MEVRRNLSRKLIGVRIVCILDLQVGHYKLRHLTVDHVKRFREWANQDRYQEETEIWEADFE